MRAIFANHYALRCVWFSDCLRAVLRYGEGSWCEWRLERKCMQQTRLARGKIDALESSDAPQIHLLARRSSFLS